MRVNPLDAEGRHFQSEDPGNVGKVARAEIREFPRQSLACCGKNTSSSSKEGGAENRRAIKRPLLVSLNIFIELLCWPIQCKKMQIVTLPLQLLNFPQDERLGKLGKCVEDVSNAHLEEGMGVWGNGDKETRRQGDKGRIARCKMQIDQNRASRIVPLITHYALRLILYVSRTAFSLAAGSSSPSTSR